MHPFLPFCIFLAARVFIQHVKLHPNDHDTASSIRFLLCAMTVMQAVNPLAACFLVQLDVDLEGTGLEAHPDEARYQQRFDKSAVSLFLCYGVNAPGAREKLTAAGGTRQTRFGWVHALRRHLSSSRDCCSIRCEFQSS